VFPLCKKLRRVAPSLAYFGFPMLISPLSCAPLFVELYSNQFGKY
jgi:hypothetical protein